MSKHFLGKEIPRTTSPKKQVIKPKRTIQGAVIMAVPFLAFMIFLSFSPQNATNSAQSARAVGRVLAENKKPPVQAPAPAAVVCDAATFKNAFLKEGGSTNTLKIFPFIPTELTVKGGCGPTTWNRDVISYFIYKILVIFNWVAGAATIMLTIYGGILYTTGFANEATVKTAKSIIIGAYTGLIIVILARVLVYSTVDLFSNTNAETAITSLPFIIDPNNK